MSGTQPILAVAMSLLGESGKGAAKDLLETTLRDFIDGKVSLAKARSVFASHAGNEKPVLRLHQIMSVDECPLPATGDLFFASGSDLRSLNPRKKARPWTEQEDTRLLAGIFRFGLDSWKAVAEFVGSGRSQAQCSQRWNRGLDPSLSKAPWSPEEEKRLVELVAEYGEKSWKRVAMSLGNRSDVQCRYHFQQLQKHNEQEKLLAQDTEKKETSDPVKPVIDMRTTIDQIFNVQIEKGLWDPWCDGEFAGPGTESLLF